MAEGTELQRDEDGTPLHIALKAQPKMAAQDSRAAFPSAKGFNADDEVRRLTRCPFDLHSMFEKQRRSLQMLHPAQSGLLKSLSNRCQFSALSQLNTHALIKAIFEISRGPDRDNQISHPQGARQRCQDCTISQSVCSQLLWVWPAAGQRVCDFCRQLITQPRPGRSRTGSAASWRS